MSRDTLTTGEQVRAACRVGVWNGQTSGLALGYAQANLAVLPEELAESFFDYCRRNPKPCPLLDMTDPGRVSLRRVAPKCDLRTDLPAYRIWEQGRLVNEPTDVIDRWRDDFVGFAIGCSFTFEAALLEAGIPVRHLELGRNVPMYRTNIPTTPAGVFQGPMVVSMRPLTSADAQRAAEITSHFPDVHGEPIQLGNPEKIGVMNLASPDFGEAVPIADDEIPVFWACGVTPQSAIMTAKPEVAITHSPGCMLVLDVTDAEISDGGVSLIGDENG